MFLKFYYLMEGAMASKKYIYDVKGRLIRIYVQIRLKGHPPEHGVFENETKANRWIQQTEAAIREGRYFKVAEARKHTVGELIDRYILEVMPRKPKSRQQQTTQLLWWKKQIGHYVLSEVTPSLLVECRESLLKEVTRRGKERSAASTVWYMSAFSHALSIARKEWDWISESPISKVKKPREPRGRTRFLDDSERERLLQSCKESNNPHLYAIVVLALSSGMRQSEILNLKWSDVDLERGRIVLYETKNGSVRQVAVTGLALILLKDLDKVRRIDTHYLCRGGRHPGYDP